MIKYVAASFALLLSFAPSVALAQDAEAGKAGFRKSAARHNAATTANQLGPHPQGVADRPPEASKDTTIRKR